MAASWQVATSTPQPRRNDSRRKLKAKTRAKTGSSAAANSSSASQSGSRESASASRNRQRSPSLSSRGDCNINRGSDNPQVLNNRIASMKGNLIVSITGRSESACRSGQVTRAPSDASRPAIVLNRLDFPDPLGPVMATRRPASMGTSSPSAITRGPGDSRSPKASATIDVATLCRDDGAGWLMESFMMLEFRV